MRVAQEPLNIAGKNVMLGCIQNVLKGTMLIKKKSLLQISCFMDLWISQIIKQSIRLISCGSVSFRKTKNICLSVIFSNVASRFTEKNTVLQLFFLGFKNISGAELQKKIFFF